MLSSCSFLLRHAINFVYLPRRVLLSHGSLRHFCPSHHPQPPPSACHVDVLDPLKFGISLSSELLPSPFGLSLALSRSPATLARHWQKRRKSAAAAKSAKWGPKKGEEEEEEKERRRRRGGEGEEEAYLPSRIDSHSLSLSLPWDVYS